MLFFNDEPVYSLIRSIIIIGATYLCKICEKHFLHELEFQTHIQEQHHDTKYNCNECTKKFQTEKSFLVHQSVHQPNQTTKKE